MKTKTQIFREAERLSRKKYGSDFAYYRALCFCGGFIKKIDSPLHMEGAKERMMFLKEYREWRECTKFERAIEDLLDEE